MNNNTNNSTAANTPKKVCVAYSGGLDTSCIIPWLRETYGCTVVACVADVGQGQRELDGIGEKATKTGASECIIVDLKETFLREFAFPMAIAGPVRETIKFVSKAPTPRWHRNCESSARGASGISRAVRPC
jgi:argininosuccinate synthase